MAGWDDDSIEPTVEQPARARLKGRYLIERELSRGGLGVVYFARDETLHGRPVVVKMPLANAADRPWLAEKFAQEVKALALIDHPGVVGALDSGVTADGSPFLVMQYVEGRSLKDAIPPEGLPYDHAAHVLRQIGHALSAAHACNIWHRDLKPANIMLQRTADGGEYVRLIDFGIASVRDSLSRSQTNTAVAGTLPYMAPEQLEGRVSAATDMFAFAVIAYEVITGRKPFVAQDQISLSRLHKAGLSLRPSQLRPDIPANAERLIVQGLAFRREDRPRSASTFGDELARLLVQTGPAAPPPTRRNAIALAVGVLLVGTGATAWLAMPSKSAATPAMNRAPMTGGEPAHQPVQIAAPPPTEFVRPQNPVVLATEKPPRQTEASTTAKPEKSHIYSGPKEGRLVWSGDLEPGQEMDLGSKEVAASVSGALPGVPVSIELHPSSLQVVTPPSAANEWRHLTIRNAGKKQVIVLVTWTVVPR